VSDATEAGIAMESLFLANSVSFLVLSEDYYWAICLKTQSVTLFSEQGRENEIDDKAGNFR
jgi:hypothetical protein